MKHILFCFVLMGAIIQLVAEPEIKGTPAELNKYLKEMPTVALTVTSKRVVKADEAIIHFVIANKEDTLTEAMNENFKVLGNIKTSLKKMGFKDEVIKAKGYSSLPEYSFYSSKPTSFSATKRVSIKVNSEAEILKIVSILDEHKSADYQKMTFNFSGAEKLMKDLLTENLKKITEEKVVYEKALGVKLIVKNFSEVQPHKGGNQVASQFLAGQLSFTSTLGSGIRNLNELGMEWQVDSTQKGFAETKFQKSLVIVYSVDHP